MSKEKLLINNPKSNNSEVMSNKQINEMRSEVIHCKDCGVPHNKWTGCPKLNGLVTHPDFYCACAEPKMKGGAE